MREWALSISPPRPGCSALLTSVGAELERLAQKILGEQIWSLNSGFSLLASVRLCPNLASVRFYVILPEWLSPHFFIWLSLPAVLPQVVVGGKNMFCGIGPWFRSWGLLFFFLPLSKSDDLSEFLFFPL